MWYVIGLIWLALVVGIFWAYQRKSEKRSAGRAQQLDVLFSELKLNSRPGAGAAAGAATATAVAQGGLTPVAEFGKKQRLLPQAGAMLYYIFRTGLPNHEIFSNLTLADVIEIEPAVRGYEREQKARRLAQQRLDFVICTKQLEVVAAVLVTKGGAPDAAQAEHTRFAEGCLQTAGIHLVRIDPAAPPRHHQVRELVYGASGSAVAEPEA